MDTIKNIILIACIMGVISVIFDFLLPEGSSKKQFRLLLGLVVVLALVSPFMDKGFEISMKKFDVDFSEKAVSNHLTEKETDVILSEAENKTEEYFLDKLNKNGLKADEIRAELEINKDNEIEIPKITVKGNYENDTDKEKITNLIKEELKNCQVEFIGDEENEH